MILIGYQGIGKSTLAGRYGCVDLESSCFYGNNGIKVDGWHVAYSEMALHLSRQGFVAMVASHASVREYLGLHNSTDERICICYPSIQLKYQWIAKLQQRYNHDMTRKNLNALENARERYSENIGEIVDDAERYGFVKMEIQTMDYSLEEMLLSQMPYLGCNGCGRNVLLDRNDYYMLKDDVWDRICTHEHVDISDVLCRKCGERILGRKFTKDDLADVPLNEGLEW